MLEEQKNINPNNKSCLEKMKGQFTLKYIFLYLTPSKRLELVRYNKRYQEMLNIGLNDYEKEYKKIGIEIELNPVKNNPAIFINIPKKKEPYFHIFFDDDVRESIIKKNFITKNEKIKRAKIVIDDGVKSLAKLFMECKCIQRINFIKFNIKNINNMSRMFQGCSSLEEILFSNIITDEVKRMESMFSNCSSLKEINLSKFETNNVRNMSWMFHGCSSLEKINLSNFSTKNVKDMRNMFFNCSSIKHLDLSCFDTNNVKDMQNMFGYCSSLESLDLSNFNTDSVGNMSAMFIGCSKLEKLNLANFHGHNAGNIGMMFQDCTSLKELDLSQFVTNNAYNNGSKTLFITSSSCTSFLTNMKIKNVIITSGMFSGCKALKYSSVVDLLILNELIKHK